MHKGAGGIEGIMAEWNTDTLVTEAMKDYSKTDWPWTLFDAEAKKERHETVFPEEIKKAFRMGAELVNR